MGHPAGLFELKGFPAAQAAQMTIAIGKLAARLKSDCCIDADTRRRILNHLEPYTYGEGAEFYYSKENFVVSGVDADGVAGPFPLQSIGIAESAMNGSDACPLEGIILHELVHLTWYNAVWLPIVGVDPETDAYAKSAACYGSGCARPPAP